MRTHAPLGLMVLTTVLAAGGGAIAAVAAPATTSVTVEAGVTGNAPKFCALAEPVINAQVSQTNIRNLDGEVLTIDVLADSTDLTTKAANVGVSLDAVCNFAHRLTLASDNNGLWRQPVAAPEPNGFAGGIPYTLTMDWDGATTVLNAQADSHNAVQQTTLVGQPNAGQIDLTFAVQPGATDKATNTPLLAGQYRDTIRITVAPQ